MGGDVYPNRDVFGLIHEPIEDGEGDVDPNLESTIFVGGGKIVWEKHAELDQRVESELTSRKLWYKYQQLETGDF